MTEVEKVRVLLPHLIEHNHGHGDEFAKWAKVLSGSGQEEAASLMEKAINSFQEANEALIQALEKIGGPLEGQKHSHHHGDER